MQSLAHKKHHYSHFSPGVQPGPITDGARSADGKAGRLPSVPLRQTPPYFALLVLWLPKKGAVHLYSRSWCWAAALRRAGTAGGCVTRSDRAARAAAAPRGAGAVPVPARAGSGPGGAAAAPPAPSAIDGAGLAGAGGGGRPGQRRGARAERAAIAAAHRRTMVGDHCSLPGERPVLAQSPKPGLSCKMVLQAVGKVLR